MGIVVNPKGWFMWRVKNEAYRGEFEDLEPPAYPCLADVRFRSSVPLTGGPLTEAFVQFETVGTLQKKINALKSQLSELRNCEARYVRNKKAKQKQARNRKKVKMLVPT